MASGYEQYRSDQAAVARLEAVASQGPTTELGTPFMYANPLLGITNGPRDIALLNLAQAEDLEHVPELMHPNSVATYRSMRNDAHLDALYRGTMMPILRYKWMIDENGCDAKRVKALAADLGLPIRGHDPEPIARYKKRFKFRQHLADALRALYYGHYCFEIVGEVDDPVFTPSGRLKKGTGVWHLRKLAPRPPHTLDDLILADDGGLVAVKQNSGGRDLPVDRIVWYSWDQEGANWWGRSWFRSCYRNWLIKDRLIRVDAVKHERNGMGVPVGIGAQGYTDDELKALARLAQSFRAGENAGGAIPFGTDLKILGVTGEIPDTILSIRFHNEEMSRSWLSMLIDLGQTKYGSRALGEEFGQRLDLGQDAVAQWFRDIFIEHVIEDYWDWNYGEDEELTPRLVYEHDDDPRVATADLALMIQNDVIQVDEKLEMAVRQAMHLPDKDPESIRLKPKPQSPTPENPPNLEGQEKPTPTKATRKEAVGALVSSPAIEPGRLHPEDIADREGGL